MAEGACGVTPRERAEQLADRLKVFGNMHHPWHESTIRELADIIERAIAEAEREAELRGEEREREAIFRIVEKYWREARDVDDRVAADELRHIAECINLRCEKVKP